MAFPPTETIAIDSGTNKQHQVRTTETVVKASQGFHSNVLTREVQEDSMTVAPSQHIAITITPARTNSPSMGILTNKYIAIKINRTDNTANDESIMAIIRAIFKSILKAAPETNKLLDPITRRQGNISDSIETRVIRRYVHKGSLTKDYFHGLIHSSTPQPMDILGKEKVQKVLTKYHTILSLSLANFGTSPVVMVGVLYGTMAAENRV